MLVSLLLALVAYPVKVRLAVNVLKRMHALQLADLRKLLLILTKKLEEFVMICAKNIGGVMTDICIH